MQENTEEAGEKNPLKIGKCTRRPKSLPLNRINVVLTNITLPDLENLTTLDGLNKKHFEEKVI